MYCCTVLYIKQLSYFRRITPVLFVWILDFDSLNKYQSLQVNFLSGLIPTFWIHPCILRVLYMYHMYLSFLLFVSDCKQEQFTSWTQCIEGSRSRIKCGVTHTGDCKISNPSLLAMIKVLLSCQQIEL